MTAIWTLMIPFYALVGGILLGLYVPAFLQWYSDRQEARWQEARDAIPPAKTYPRRIVEFREGARGKRIVK